jgi:hypothetical protein
MVKQDQFLTKSKFAKLVEVKVREHRYSYMDAVIDICEDIELDLEDIRKYVSGSIKEKIEVEAMNLNYLPKGNTLPLD